MDISEAKVKISKLTDPRLSDVATLLVDLDLELIACCEEIRRGKSLIGDVDLLFKDKDVKKAFFIEVSTQYTNRAEKINQFFTLWEDQDDLGLVRDKFNLPATYDIVRIYFDLSGKLDCPPSVASTLKRRKNHFLNEYDYDYFLDAFTKVGKWAKNDLFSYLNIKPRGLTSEDKPAIQFFLGDDIRAYVYVDTAKELLQYCYISRRKKDDKGYQRMLEKGRIGSIAKKIQNRTIFAFPNSILISSPDVPQLCNNPAEKSGCPCSVPIKVPNYYSACRVIDGQHRLLAFANLEEQHQEEHFLPVVALEDIEQHQEMKTFIEINSGQKKIDRNLILVLEADFDWDVSKNPIEFFEKEAVIIVKRLNNVRGSPLRNKIFIPEALAKRKGKITLNTLVTAILRNNFIGKKHKLFQKNYNDTETPYRKIRDIFVLCKQKLPRYCKDVGSFLLTNKGLRILFRLVQIFERNRRNKNIRFTLSTFFDHLRKIFDDSLIERLEDFYGEGGANRAVEEIFRILKKLDKPKYKNLTTDLRQV